MYQKYFPDLNVAQQQQLGQLPNLYTHWNSQINVVSRKDITELPLRHVLHSLAIAKVINFAPGTQLLDVGTGGGFPGIPLAILFPQVQFTLCDSIGKKIKVVQEVANALGLSNVVAVHARAEKVPGQFDFVISRAVTRMKPFINWVHSKIKPDSHHPLENGILYLKGGDLTEEMNETKRPYQLFAIGDFFEDAFFETKQVVHVPLG